MEFSVFVSTFITHQPSRQCHISVVEFISKLRCHYTSLCYNVNTTYEAAAAVTIREDVSRGTVLN